VALLAVWCAGGCGERGATVADLQAFCSSMCDWRIRCNKDDPTCHSECETTEVTISSYRADFVRAMGECFETLPCDKKDDDCFSAALLQVEPDFSSDELFTRCNSVRQGCISAEKPAFSDDYCFTAMVLTSTARASFVACFDQPCEEMRGCMRAAMGEAD
jgi:hypothetical protein